MPRRLLILAALICALVLPAHAQDRPAAMPYDIGVPVVMEIYVNPATGSDANAGNTPEAPYATLDAAWRQIPVATPLTTGYRINLAPGVYDAANVPVYMEQRYGSAAAPIIIQAAPGTSTLASLNVFDVRYLYLIGVTIQDAGDTIFHCERCDHLLLRDVTVTGAEPATFATQETVKVNQSQYVYIENSDIGGAWDNAVDFVAVQYGHVIDSRIHTAGDWCVYAKGGSAYLRLERNILHHCGTGGFTAGQGTGFQYMTVPWLHYEAYDIQFVNNVLHDLDGAAFGAQGAYNLLIAYNTAYRVGARSHLIEAGFGGRSCDGPDEEPTRQLCAQYLQMGGWGNTLIADGENFARIPNRHVRIVNNVIFNPAPYQSQWQQFQIFAPYGGEWQAGTNAPNPALADDDLTIAGNVIWNGPITHPLGTEFDAGCAAGNPTCTLEQLIRDNTVNTAPPTMANPDAGDFRLAGVNFISVAVPDFGWDLPFTTVPPGDGRLTVSTDFTGAARVPGGLPGAFAVLAGGVFGQVTAVPTETATPVITPHPTIEGNPDPTPEAQTVEPLPPGPITLITLGDSLTEGSGDDDGFGGYPVRLLDSIDESRPGSVLVNLGRSGWNSDAMIDGDQGMSGQLPVALKEAEAAQSADRSVLALIWIGSNDLWYLYEFGPEPMRAEDEAADLENFERNLDHAMTELNAAGAALGVALLDDQSLRPVALAGQAFTAITPDDLARMSLHVRNYNTVIQRLAALHGAVVVDFYDTTIFTDPATLADDGNHPNASGYALIARRWSVGIAPLIR